jgi:hypothetical protein
MDAAKRDEFKPKISFIECLHVECNVSEHGRIMFLAKNCQTEDGGQEN